MLQVKLTKDEAKTLTTSILVAHGNALYELRKARELNKIAMVEYLQTRVTALDKLKEAVDEYILCEA